MTGRKMFLALVGAAFAATASAQAALPQRINDSGLKTCYAGGIPTDSGVGTTSCTSTSWPGQDAAGGRDAAGASLPKTGAGDAGFDFTKLSNAGHELPATAQAGSAPNAWGCTRDNVTGLVWRIAETPKLKSPFLGK